MSETGAHATVTPDEQAIAEELGAVWNQYLQLPVEHPTERQEFCTALHRLQDMVLARAGRRAINPVARANSGANPVRNERQ